MEDRVYRTITGRKLRLGELTEKEQRFVGEVARFYQEEPEWSEFSAWWTTRLRGAKLASDSMVYRLCQDLEARLGIAQGKVSPPDYRDYLADLIDERYGSRYRFCKEAGIDPGHLSRVLASRSNLSLQTLQAILGKLRAALVVQPEEALKSDLSPEAVFPVLATSGS
ncbi:MAG TPA: hypothetical protein VLV83_05900 [Acidobacteriota bacterium]|nr:hypothetical protein [Acidobacteriota bacterium]